MIQPKNLSTQPAVPAPPLSWAALSALGVVFGDLGTSPLYTLQTVVQATGGQFTAASALGILSLIIWTLLITVSVKYCLFVMRADNHGEGGILALMSLVGANSFKKGTKVLTCMGLLGAALLYGDGAITPAISVLSALEGVNAVTPALKPFVMPAALLILIALFAAQRVGTERIGRAFGPIMLFWFVVIAALGCVGIARHPRVLAALNPEYAASYLAHSGAVGWLVLGGVFLCITGAEALYADMGHFGRAPIRWAWFLIVLPALLISYAGQTGLMLDGGQLQGNPFFLLAPTWAIYPLVLLATIATIIASQAIITGAFSMTRQAMQLGWLPGVGIRQTSDQVYGQIYVPAVNWLMMIATVAITFGFGSSDRLAGAYGTAVSTTMMLTTALLYTAIYKVWGWSRWAAALVGGLFLVVDMSFFGANLLKIADGGWLPLTLGLLIFTLMLIWRSGVEAVRASTALNAPPAEQFIANLQTDQIPRVPGTAVFLTRSTQSIPPLLIEHVRQMGALHQHVIALHVVFEETPRVVHETRCALAPLGSGLWHITMRFGFMEIPDLRARLKELGDLHPSANLDHAIFFGSRDLVVRKTGSKVLTHGRLQLFGFLYRNAVRMVDRFYLPPRSVVEIARLVEI
jgi:KUP system potassium uptake protein